ncbi:MAG: hypothetical protein AB7T31_15445 [Gemmatimonadales bacterium]
MRTLWRRWPLGLLPVVAACGITDVQAPALLIDEEVGEPFVEALDAAGLEAVVQAGGAEFELFLLDDGVTAGDLAVRTDGGSSTERLQSRIDSFEDGRLGLLLGDLRVGISPTTRFWLGDAAVGREAFENRIRSELAAGRQPPVVAERGASESPRAPGDADFVAEDLILGGDGAPSLRMKVGRDHLERVSAPSLVDPDAWLRVLGLYLRLKMRDGTTDASRHRHHFPSIAQFGAEVVAVDLEARSIELADGKEIRVTGRTDFDRRRGFARTLREAAEALERGDEVHARGLGVVEGRDRVRFLALRIALKIEAAEEPVPVEFDGMVASVVPGDVGRVVLLADGTRIQIREGSEVLAADDDSPATIDELVDVLAEGRDVEARGVGYVVEETPRVLKAVRIVLRSEAPQTTPLDVLQGVADFVDASSSVVLMDGTMIVVGPATQLVAGNANSPTTLQELTDMLDQNRRVEVRGEGTLQDPSTLTAVRLEMTAVVGTFDADILSVDPDTGGLLLANGSFVLLTGTTVMSAIGSGPTDLDGIASALSIGDRVLARGTGYVRGRIPRTNENFEATAVELELIPAS